MVMGIPSALAQQMAADLEESFISKRSRMTDPEKRVLIKPHATDPPE